MRHRPGRGLPLLQPREVGAEGPHHAVLELDRHVLVVAEVLDVDHLPLAELGVQYRDEPLE